MRPILLLAVFALVNLISERGAAGQKEPAKAPEVDGKKLSEWANLLSGEDVVERQGAVLALAKFGPPAVPALAHALDDKQLVNVRLWAAHALGKIGAKAEGAVPRLEAALKDPSGLVRVEAALALWRIGQYKEAVPALIKELKDADPGVRSRAAEMLGAIGPPAKKAVPGLVEGLKDPGVMVKGRPEGDTLVPVREAMGRALKKVDPETAKKHGIE
jgi:HEAT repeat protein